MRNGRPRNFRANGIGIPRTGTERVSESRGIRKRRGGPRCRGGGRRRRRGERFRVGVARLASRCAGTDLYARPAGSTTRERCLAGCISYLFIGGGRNRLAIPARARENGSPEPPFPGFPPAALFLFRRTDGTSRARERRPAGGSWSRSEGGSDAGASAEPSQGAGALRCLRIASSSASTVSSLCHLPDSPHRRYPVPFLINVNPQSEFPLSIWCS